MSPQQTYDALQSLLGTVRVIGFPIQGVIALGAVLLALFALVPDADVGRRRALAAMAVVLGAGEVVLLWFHWRLWQLCTVVDPSTGRATLHVAISPWLESEKLYVWALLVAIMGLLMRRQRAELMQGVMFAVAALSAMAALLGQPFSNPLPSFLSQYVGYLQALSTGGQAAAQASLGMAETVAGYYNAWFMWVHPPLLFFSYAAFTVSFVATVQMILTRHSAFETTAYGWARIGYLALTLGMLLGLPWALMSWQGEAWWWSGKINMSIMMWVLYTAYLHARLYLRRQGMWKAVALLAVLSFVILVLTYTATYVVPGAHSYAMAPAASRALGFAQAVASRVTARIATRGGAG